MAVSFPFNRYAGTEHGGIARDPRFRHPWEEKPMR
jgi:hypothetical protein